MEFDVLKSAYNSGKFVYTDKDKLAVECNAPNSAGVYLIYSKTSQGAELLFVGSSGSVSQNGSIGTNTLRHRILIRRDGTDREYFLKRKMQTDHISYFEIEWYHTYENKEGSLPKFAEASILQEYFKLNGKLPPWNKEY